MLVSMSWEQAGPLYLYALLGGYLLGSVPFGLILTRFAGMGDIRDIGSGNIGATNVLRTGNKGLAAATLLADAGKGIVAVLIASAWGPEASLFAGTGAFLGHIFPVWLKFKGGKGVATFFGVVLAWAWPVGLMAIATWGAVAYFTKYSSLAALITVGLTPLYFATTGHPIMVPFAAFLTVMIFLRHQENIDRLRKGEESKIGGGKE